MRRKQVLGDCKQNQMIIILTSGSSVFVLKMLVTTTCRHDCKERNHLLYQYA